MKSDKDKTLKGTKGTYVAVKFNELSNKLFNEILDAFGLTKDFDDDFHCTIAYSRKALPYFKTSKGDPDRSNIIESAKIKDFGHFDTDKGKNLHIVLDSKYCLKEFNRSKNHGATYDHDKYTPHITLMCNCKEFTYNDELGKKFIGKPITIVEEYIEDLNLNRNDNIKKEEADETNKDK